MALGRATWGLADKRAEDAYKVGYEMQLHSCLLFQAHHSLSSSTSYELFHELQVLPLEDWRCLVGELLMRMMMVSRFVPVMVSLSSDVYFLHPDPRQRSLLYAVR